MMSKYIDADRLRAEIIRLRKDQPFHNDSSFLAYLHGLSMIEDFIDSLQPAPEVDLEKAAISFGDEIGIPVSDTFLSIARHFFELGINTRCEE